MAKQIIIDITPAGTVKIDAQGFNGVGCDKATQEIELAIGGAAPKSKKKKPEYFVPGGQANTTKQAF